MNGIANAILQVGFMSAVMMNIPSQNRGKVFSFYIVASTSGSIISLIISQKMLEILNIQTIYRIGAIIILIISLIRFVKIQYLLKNQKEEAINIE